MGIFKFHHQEAGPACGCETDTILYLPCFMEEGNKGRKGHEVKNPEFGQGHFDNRPHRSDSTSHLLLTGFTRQNAALPADVKTAKAKVICEGFLSPPIQLVQVKSNHFLWVRVAMRCGFTPRTSHCPLTRTWCHSTPM